MRIPVMYEKDQKSPATNFSVKETFKCESREPMMATCVGSKSLKMLYYLKGCVQVGNSYGC